MENLSNIKLTAEERMFLSIVDKKYKYIVRDKDSKLYLFENKPIKSYVAWLDKSGDYRCVDLINESLFKFIKFENKEPYKIKELLSEDFYGEN